MTTELVLRDGATAFVDGQNINIVEKEKGITYHADKAIFDAVRYGFIDAIGGAFFARELENIRAQVIEIKYPEHPFRDVFPINGEDGRGTEFVTFRIFDKTGIADFINQYGQGVKTVDVTGREVSSKVEEIALAYTYSISDLEAAQKANRSLNDIQIKAVHRGIEAKHNEIAFDGDDKRGLVGFFDHPNIPRATVAPNAAGTSTQYYDKTPYEVLFDMHEVVNDINVNTNLIERANMLLVSPDFMNYATSTRMSIHDSTTIMEAFLSANRFIKSLDQVKEINQCSAAFNPNLTSDIMVAYHKDIESIEYVLPLEEESIPAQQVDLNFKVSHRARLGGTIVKYPLSVNIAEWA